MIFRKTIASALFLAGNTRFQAQGYIGVMFHQSDLVLQRQSYSLGVAGEYQVGRNKRLYLDFQHDVGVTNKGQFFVNTTLPFALYASTFGSNSYHHWSGNGDALIVASILPSGATYYYTQTRQVRYGVFFNPLNYSYWQTEKGSEISMFNPEIGFKALKRFDHDTWMMLTVGLGYSISIGSGNLLPRDYYDCMFINARLAIVHGKF